MPKDPIVQIGAAVLRERAKPVAKKDIGSRKLSSLLARMSAALKKEEFGVAIAAPQVDEPLRVFVVAGKVFSGPEETVPDKVFINPELTKKSKSKKEMTEGCLSVRHKYGAVLRHEKTSIRAWDKEGKPFTYHGSGLIAQIFQHEVDHLEGILYVDKATVVQDDEEWKELKQKRKNEK